MTEGNDVGISLNILKNEIATSEQRYAILRFPRRGKHPSATLLLLFRKKPRSARLLSCKRAHDVSLSLPPFCELRLRRYKKLKIESGKWKMEKILLHCIKHPNRHSEE